MPGKTSTARLKWRKPGEGEPVYALFFLMGLAVLAALIVVPCIAAAFLPWWGTLLVVLGELVFLRYTLFRIVGMMFAIFVSVGLRLGTMNMRRARVDVHGISIVPKPDLSLVPKPNTGSVDLEEHEAAVLEPDAEGTRYVKLDCTITPAANAAGPVRHFEAGGFKLSSEGLALPKFPPTDDPTKTGEVFAAALVKDGVSIPIPLDEQLVGSQRLDLVFKCPPTLTGKVKLKFMVIKLAEVVVP
jgi:hypothetical protein